MRSSFRPAAIAFVGPSGSGKTTLIERMVRHFALSGVRVGLVKHTHHQVEWDQPGKDSWRFREAGAAAVILASPERLLLQRGRRRSAGEFAGLLENVEIVIHEGDRHSDLDKVLLGESLEEALAKGTGGRIIAVVGGRAEAGLPWFDRDDVAGVCRFVLQRAGRDEAGNSAGQFEDLLERSVAAHGHLCPGQVLGVRITLRGLKELGIAVPPPAKRLIAIVETDRCAADAVASVTGCSLGRRTLKHFDFGKMAATFLDLSTGDAVRVIARDDSRDQVAQYARGVADPHEAQTIAYRAMPDDELLRIQRVRVDLSEADRPGRPRSRIACSRCGEHVSDDRHMIIDGGPVCRACAGSSYYTLA